jgi:uncharacterized protein (TIGR03083 family)
VDDGEAIAAAGALATAIVAAGRQGGPDCWIPSCPAWRMADLVPHVAVEYAVWYYANLTAPADQDPFAAAATAAPPCPSDYDAAVDYLERYAARFCERAAQVDLDAPVWAYAHPAPARFWLRMAIGEVGAHAWDATRAVGHPSPLSANVAAEAIDQFITFMLHRGQPSFLPSWRPPSESLSLTATDSGRSWLLEGPDGDVRCTRGRAAEAAVRVEAAAEDLYLAWFGRQASNVRVTGDPATFLAWRSDH